MTDNRTEDQKEFDIIVRGWVYSGNLQAYIRYAEKWVEEHPEDETRAKLLKLMKEKANGTSN